MVGIMGRADNKRVEGVRLGDDDDDDDHGGGGGGGDDDDEVDDDDELSFMRAMTVSYVVPSRVRRLSGPWPFGYLKGQEPTPLTLLCLSAWHLHFFALCSLSFTLVAPPPRAASWTSGGGPWS